MGEEEGGVCVSLGVPGYWPCVRCALPPSGGCARGHAHAASRRLPCCRRFESLARRPPYFHGRIRGHLAAVTRLAQAAAAAASAADASAAETPSSAASPTLRIGPPPPPSDHLARFPAPIPISRQTRSPRARTWNIAHSRLRIPARPSASETCAPIPARTHPHATIAAAAPSAADRGRRAMHSSGACAAILDGALRPPPAAVRGCGWRIWSQ
jgi:hypothetical protein